jgi:hypothetical protein
MAESPCPRGASKQGLCPQWSLTAPNGQFYSRDLVHVLEAPFLVPLDMVPSTPRLARFLRLYYL